METLVRALLLSGIMILLCFIHSQAATLNVINGELYGAQKVEVKGGYYDVEFKDGKAEDLFKRNGVWEFTFDTVEKAKLASQSLYEQVFIQADGYKPFDDNPELTIGVSSQNMGVISTPFQLDGYGTSVANWAMVNYSATDGTEDLVPVNGPYYSGGHIDYSFSPFYTYAIWTRAVPEQSTGILVMAGLLWMTNISRKRLHL